MKRKFGNLLMVATLMFAVGSFFASCRDYDEELVAMIDQQSQDIEDLNEKLSEAIDDLNGEIKNALASAQAEIAGLEKQIGALNAQIDALNARIEVLEGINHDHSNFVTKDELAAVEAELAAAKAELAAAKAELEAAVKELADKKADKQTLEEVKKSLEASIEGLKGELASHIVLFNQLSATVTEALGRLSTLEGKYADLEARVKAIEDAKYQEQINAIKGDLEKVVKQAAEADARSKANEAAIDVLEAYNVEFAQAVKDSVAALRAEAAANLAEAKAYADEAAAAVAAELAKTNATVAELQAAFNEAVAELQDQIDVLAEELDEMKESLGLLKKEMDEMKENQITSIVLNGAYSPVVGYFSLPTGVKSNILAAYYGDEANDFHFPTTRTVYNVAGSGAFTDADFEVLGIQETKYDGGVIVADGNNAGKLYVTFNPAEVSLEGKEFAFVNSLGEESPVKIDVDNVKQTEDKLTFGYTRAGAVALYEMPAKLAAEDVEAAKLRIELSDLKDALQDVVSVSDGINVTDLVTTLYAVVNDIADANAVQATWTDSYGDTHTVYSDFGLAAVAVKPLGYNSLADLNVSAMPGYNTAVNVLNKVFDKIGDINIPNNALAKLESISFNTIEDSIKFNLVIEGTTAQASVSTKELLDDLGGVSLETLNKVIEAVNKALPLISGKVEAVETQINAAMNKVQSGLNKYLDKLNNKLCSMVNSFNAALQPTMLVSTTDGFSLLSSIKAAPTTIDQASAVLVPTSFSGEILAPASKKYVAVTKAYDANGNLDVAAAKAANTGDLNSVLEGCVRTVAFSGKSGYTYEIAYSAVDFYGRISTTKYYVKVK